MIEDCNENNNNDCAYEVTESDSSSVSTSADESEMLDEKTKSQSLYSFEVTIAT